VPYWADETVTLLHGKCEDILPRMPAESVDAVVTDPPYDLTSGEKGGTGEASLNEKHPAGRSRITTGGGFMGKEWDATGVAFDPATWRAVMRVMKPGAHLLAFGGARTWHRMVCAIEDAGFEIRDPIADLTGMDAPGLLWIQGQGYPKNLDVSKAIDKQQRGATVRAKLLHFIAERGITGRWLVQEGVADAKSLDDWTDGGHVPSDRNWQIVKAALKVTDEEEAAFERSVIGKGYRIRRESSVNLAGPSGGEYDITAAATEEAATWEGWGTALKPAWEPVCVARKPLAGTVAQNVLAHGTGALNLAACKVGSESRVNNAGGASSLQRVSRVKQGYRPNVTTSSNEDSAIEGRWPPNIVLGEVAATELDRQSGVLSSGANPTRRSSDKFRDAYGEFAGQAECIPHRGADSGGASRFFPVFRYEAKAGGAERPKLPDGTAWPTVKPLDFIRWLVRLVTPPGGVVLDPFCGSGTTAEACIVEGFSCITIDRDPVALQLAMQRLSKPIQPAMLAVDDCAPPAPVRPVAASRPKPVPEAHPSLFDLEDAS
jgi:site-specific DNA-methyltransferase (adenine-specific)